MKSKRNPAQMRETAAVLMFVVVFLSILKPVSPFIADILGHTFWSEQHHTKLHQNGVNHVDEQVQKMNGQENENSNKTSASAFHIETSLIYFDQNPNMKLFISCIAMQYSEPINITSQQNITPEIQPPDNISNVLPFYA